MGKGSVGAPLTRNAAEIVSEEELGPAPGAFSEAHGLHDPEGPSAVHPIEGLGKVEEEHGAVGVVGGEQVGELGVGEDVVADPAAGQEAGLGGVDDGLQGGGQACADGARGDLDVGVDAGNRTAVGEVAGVGPLGDEGVVRGALAG